MKFVQSYTDIDIFQSLTRNPIKEKLFYHCIWFGKPLYHHILSLASLFQTQANPHVILWTNEESAPLLKSTLEPIFSGRHSFEVRVYQPKLEGIVYEKSPFHPFWTADDWRIEILYEYGGIYVDLDILFLKDMSWMARVRGSYRWQSTGYFNPAVLIFPKAKDTFLLLTLARLRELPYRQKWNRYALIWGFDKMDKIDPNLYCFPCLWFDANWVVEGPWGVESFDKFFEPFSGDIETLFPLSVCYHWHNRWDRDVRDPSTAVGKFYKKFVIEPGYCVPEFVTPAKK